MGDGGGLSLEAFQIDLDLVEARLAMTRTTHVLTGSLGNYLGVPVLPNAVLGAALVGLVADS